MKKGNFSHRKPDEIFQRKHFLNVLIKPVHLPCLNLLGSFFYFLAPLSAHPNRLLLSLATSQINAAWFSSPSAFYSLSGEDLCPTPNSTSSVWIDLFCIFQFDIIDSSSSWLTHCTYLQICWDLYWKMVRPVKLFILELLTHHQVSRLQQQSWILWMRSSRSLRLIAK